MAKIFHGESSGGGGGGSIPSNTRTVIAGGTGLYYTVPVGKYARVIAYVYTTNAAISNLNIVCSDATFGSVFAPSAPIESKKELIMVAGNSLSAGASIVGQVNLIITEYDL